MRIHTQNLREKNGSPIGSMFWFGRAWFRRDDSFNEYFHVEWIFGRRTKGLALTLDFGYGEDDRGVCFHIALPFLFSFYLVVPGIHHCKESKVGISFHMGGIHLYTFTTTMESNSKDPWWKRDHSWYWPWELRHHLTEVLEHKANLPGLAMPVWSDKGKRFMDGYDERVAAQKSVSETYDYTYTLKSGEVQHRKATVFVSRMMWRARWWPFIPIQKVSTTIDVSFDKEIGEGTGSYKGGVVGAGHEMKPGETPMETLIRMQKEVRFNR